MSLKKAKRICPSKFGKQEAESTVFHTYFLKARDCYRCSGGERDSAGRDSVRMATLGNQSFSLNLSQINSFPLRTTMKGY